MKLHFRFAIDSDIPRIHTLVNLAFRAEVNVTGWSSEGHLLEGQRVDTQRLHAIIHNPNSLLIVAEDADTLSSSSSSSVVASMCLERYEKDPEAIYLSMLAVDPTQQSQGIGRKVFAEAERVALTHFHATQTVLQVLIQRTELVAFYERLHYEHQGDFEPFPSDLNIGRPKQEGLLVETMIKKLK